MSSHPPGLRFSPVASPISNKSKINFNNNNNNNENNSASSLLLHNNNNNNTINNNNNSHSKIMQHQHPQPQTQITKKNGLKQQPPPPPQYTAANSLSGSETDISTSNENLSFEQRYVLRHTPRVEPQGQENLQESLLINNENQVRYATDQRFSSNTSADSTRYASSNRSISETRNPIFMQQGNGGNNSNRNSLKESNSNRSSMDVSTCSYNTLIIHNDDSIYSIGNRDFPSPPEILKKDRPRSYGEQGMQEITEIPDDYLNQSHVLKHLAKEIKIPIIRRSNTRDSGMSENTDPKDPPKYGQWIIEEQNEQNNNKIKSKSQPDLTKLSEADIDTMEALVKENQLLKQQLYSCYMKVAKTQKLEEEVANIYRVHEELKQTCERREKLERAARMRLQSDLQRVQELNCVMKDQVDILQSQLLAPSEHQILIAQFFTQNKELSAAKERQEIELVAQRATLQEQRNHIGILDTALTNAQHNIRRLEDELRKKQLYIDRLTQLHGALQSKQNDRKTRLDYETELSKDSNRSGSSTNSDSKWQLQEKNQMLRLESEQRHLDDRQNTPKLPNIEKSNQEDRIITEAKQDKLRYLEEVHSAQRTVNDLQTHLKFLESKLAEKDAVIRLLQEKKICGSSFDSYNSYGLNPLGYNSQASFNVSNTSFNTTTNTSLLEQAYSGTSNNFNPTSNAITNSYVTNQNYNQTKPTYNQSAINLQAISSNYSPNNSNYSNNFEGSPNYTQNTSSYDSSYDNLGRKSIDDHMKKQIDEQLLTKKFAQYDQRERDRQEQQESQQNSNKTDDIVLLEKQGICSQKTRNNTTGNLAQVSQTVGQNMTDISNIGSNSKKVPKIVTNITQNLSNIAQTGILPPRLKERSGSLPPSALPRPPRSLKPPRKIEYDRLSDADMKNRSQTPPKISSPSAYELKTSSLKRNEFIRREFSPNKNYMEMKDTLQFPKADFSLKRKDYGTINKNDFSKPDYTSTKNYQRLEESPKPTKLMQESNTLKRSLLSNVRKYSPAPPTNTSKNSRDSLNSSESNNSTNSNQRSSPIHLKSDSSASNITLQNSRTPPKYASLSQQMNQQQRSQQMKSSMIPNKSVASSASLPPKPVDSKMSARRGNSLTRGENRYRIQF